jgi:hypothetical protein
MTLELSYPKPNPAKSNPRHRRIAFGPTTLRLAPLLANREYRSRVGAASTKGRCAQSS